METQEAMRAALRGDRYETPEGRPRFRSEALLFGSRWSVYSHFFAIVFRNRALAVRGLYDDEAWAQSSLDVVDSLERCSARFAIEGMDRLRAVPGPLVIVANHMSTLETLVLPGLVCPIKTVTFVVKRKLLQGLVWGPVMRSRDPIAVSRSSPRADLEAVLGKGKALLAAGTSIVIFPQGTRKDVWDRSEFNSLGVKLAAEAGVRVMPVALKTDYWGSSGLFRGFGPVHRDRLIHIEFGEALPVSGRGKQEHQACLDFIESRLKQWGARMA